MSENSQEIERKLIEMAAQRENKKFCERTLMKFLVILSWVILAAAAGGSLFMGLQWNSSLNDTQYYNEMKSKNENRLIQDKKKVIELNNTLESTKAELEKTKNETERYRNLTEEWQKKIDVIDKDIAAAKALLSELTKELEELKKVHEQLVVENQKLKKDLHNVTEVVKELNSSLLHKTRQTLLWKIGGGFSFLGIVFGALDDFISSVNIWESRAFIEAMQPKKLAYPLLAEGFENFLFLESKEGLKVKRTVCFQGKKKDDMKKCKGLKPTLTTITTTTGYKFGVVLGIAWTDEEGAHSDPQAYAFSDIHVKTAPIQTAEKAFVVSKEHMLQFGTTDIVIASDGKHGTALGSSYKIPAPFKNDNFFHNGTDFEVEDIKIEEILF